MPNQKYKTIDSPTFFIGVSGNGIVSFGSGQPDLPPPSQIYKILPDYHAFKYGLIQGQENLREALAKQYPHAKAENFVITNGASEALDIDKIKEGLKRINISLLFWMNLMGKFGNMVRCKRKT